MSLLGMRCKSLQRISSHAIPGTSVRRLIGAAEESRCRERRIREVRRSRLPTWVTRSPAPSSPLAICGGTSRKKEEETLWPYIRALSFVILLRPSRANLSRRSPSEVLSAFNECHPGSPPGVYFYDASKIRLTRMGEGNRMVQGEWWQSKDENGTKRRLRSENFFFYVCSFSLLVSQLLELSFFSRENSSTDLSSENDAKKTGRRGFGEILLAGSAACTRNVLRV